MANSLRTLVFAAIAAAAGMVGGCPVMAAPAHGFDVKGFVQGMHRSDAERNAQRQGYQMHDTGSGTIVSKGGQGDKVQFCRDELVSYAYAMHGGFMQYLREIKSFEGRGYRRTNLDLGTEMQPDGKESGYLTIYLFRPQDSYYVTMTLWGTEDNDTDNLALQYVALDKGAKCQQ